MCAIGGGSASSVANSQDTISIQHSQTGIEGDTFLEKQILKSPETLLLREEVEKELSKNAYYRPSFKKGTD